MATLKYYLRSSKELATIQARFNISSSIKFRASTGLKINPSEWSSEKGYPKKSSIAEIKALRSTLLNLEAAIIDKYNDDYSNGYDFTNNKGWLKDTIKEAFNQNDNADNIVDYDNLYTYIDYFIQSRKNEGYKDSTIQKYKLLKTKLSAFSEYVERDLKVSNFDKETTLTFYNWLHTENKLMKSTAKRTVKNLKAVLNHALENENIDFTISTGYKKVEASINKDDIFTDYYLSPLEIERIKATNFENEMLDIVRDWLIISCFTGQRISDFMRFDKSMIYTEDDPEVGEINIIKLKHVKRNSKKESTEVEIPILPEVQEILDKYKGNFPPKLNKKISVAEVLYNKYVKKVCEKAGINELVEAKEYDKELKKNIIKKVEKHKVVSSHIGRKSFITNFLNDSSMNSYEIQMISGHKSNKVFSGYYKQSSKKAAKSVAKKYKK